MIKMTALENPSVSKPRAARYRDVIPFVSISIAWFTLWAVWCLTAGNQEPLSTLKWLLALWALCVLDLLALTKAILAVMVLMSLTDTENDLAKRPALSIQAMFWGLMKLVCLGVLGAVLVMKSETIPRFALLAGLGTLIVVPLFGGFWWSFSSLKSGNRKATAA